MADLDIIAPWIKNLGKEEQRPFQPPVEEEVESRPHPLVAPYKKMRAAMWPSGTSQYVLKNWSPEWEETMIQTLTSEFEKYLHLLDRVAREKEEEYLEKMRSDRSIALKLLETLGYRSMTGGAVSYYYPQPNEPSLHGASKVNDFRRHLQWIQKHHKKPMRYAYEEFRPIRLYSDEDKKKVAVASAMVDYYCFRVTGTDEKIEMVADGMTDIASAGGARVRAVPPRMQINLVGPRVVSPRQNVTRTTPQVRGNSRRPSGEPTRSANDSQSTTAPRDPTEIPTQEGPARQFLIGENVPARVAVRDLFIPAFRRGRAVFRTLTQARDGSPEAMVAACRQAMRMISEQTGLEVRMIRPKSNEQGYGNVSFRNRPGQLRVDESLISKPRRLWDELFHDAAAIYLFREYTGQWPTAQNTWRNYANLQGRPIIEDGVNYNFSYQTWFENLIQDPVGTMGYLRVDQIRP